MYIAMVFHQDKVTERYVARSVRLRPYTDLENAKQAIQKTGLDGYIKRQGNNVPIWNNLRTSNGRAVINAR